MNPRRYSADEYDVVELGLSVAWSLNLENCCEADALFYIKRRELR